jgi:hypothetical protein
MDDELPPDAGDRAPCAESTLTLAEEMACELRLARGHVVSVRRALERIENPDGVIARLLANCLRRSADDATGGTERPPPPSLEALRAQAARAASDDDAAAYGEALRALAGGFGPDPVREALLAGTPPSMDLAALWSLADELRDPLDQQGHDKDDAAAREALVVTLLDLPLRPLDAGDPREAAVAGSLSWDVTRWVTDPVRRARVAARFATLPPPAGAGRRTLRQQLDVALELALDAKIDALYALLDRPPATLEEAIEDIRYFCLVPPEESAAAIAHAATLVRDPRDHARIVTLSINDGSFDRARAYAAGLLRGVYDLPVALECLAAARRHWHLGRWANARLQVVALAHALRDPEAAAEAHDDLAKGDPAKGDRLPQPGLNHHVRVLRRLEPILAKVREKLAERAYELERLAARLAYASATAGMSEEEIEAWSENDPPCWTIIARVERRLAETVVPSSPSLDFDPDDNDSLSDDADADDPYGDGDGDDGLTEFARAESEVAAKIGARSARQSLAHLGNEASVLAAVARWAASEGLLDGISGERFARSLSQSRAALRAVRYDLEGLALEEGHPDGHGSLDRILRWARAEEIVDPATARFLSEGAALPTNFTGD